MSLDQIIGVLWRRRLTFFVTALACIAAVVAVTLSLPKTYRATASLLVGTPKSSFTTTDLLNQITRTYSTLASNPHVADSVVQLLPFSTTRDSLMSAISVAPVESTQLIEISAEAHSRSRAQILANTYANAFVDDVSSGGLAGSPTLTTLSIVEPAVLPTSSVRPNPPLYIGIGTLLALLLATGAALLRERLDRRIRVSAEDVSVLGHPIVGRIPRFPRSAPAGDAVLDRFALMKTNLDFLDEREARVVVVTSPGIAEGKSTIAMHLAAACAADGERVVVIDGDLRRPGLRAAARLGGAETGVGLTDYLTGRASEYDVVTDEPSWPEIKFIWSGGQAPNPVALLRSARLESLLDSLRLDYDRVIIDTPPVSVGADASLLVARADAALFVLNEPKTTTPNAKAGVNQLEKARPQQLGIVLNRTKAIGKDSSYYYRRSDATERNREREPARSRTRV